MTVHVVEKLECNNFSLTGENGINILGWIVDLQFAKTFEIPAIPAVLDFAEERLHPQK